MLRNQQTVSVSGVLTLTATIANAIVLKTAFTTNEKWYWALTVTVPLLFLSIVKFLRTKK